MKNSLILLAGAAAFSLASCSSDNSTASTTAADGTTTTTTTTTTGPESDAAIEARAQRIADKMVADMKITDEATKTKIRTVYVNRARRLGEVRTKYTADTTGMAAAMREATTETDTEFKTIFTDPTQYQAYESNRTTYDDSNYMDDSSMGTADNSSMSSDASTTTDGAMSSGSATGSGAEVTKMKVKADGDVKMKDAAGNKMKVAGDDGTVKAKPKDGEKMKME